MTHPADFDVAVIGAGFSGLGMAIKLKEEDKRSFVVLEKEADVGGTWLVNSYPGCACDVPSHLYSYSFEPNPDWSRSFSPQEEIWSYLRRCADKYGLREHLRVNAEVIRADYDERAGIWRVTLAGGECLSARYLVAGMGALSVPRLPEIDGVAGFEGRAFHSQQWDHDYDFDGQTVAVVGTGASAIQFVPQIAPRVAKLYLFQRSAPWILKRPDRAVSGLEKTLFVKLPFVQKIYRAMIYAIFESRAIAFTRWLGVLRLFEFVANRHRKKQIDDPPLAERLKPDYRIGCKRVLLSSDFYPALNRDNVTLVDRAVERIDSNGVVAAGGERFAVDAIVYGTGFRATEPLPRGFIVGRGGRDILDAWADGPEAYLGTVVAGFPNLFLLAGPNTGLAHNSMIYMIESQLSFVMAALAACDAGDLERIEVREDAQRTYNARLQSALSGSVWMTGCSSWYLDRRGKNVALWPDYTFRFRRLLRRFRHAEFEDDDKETA